MAKWLAVPGYTAYRVSDDGRVYSVRKGIFLRQQISKFGYPRVELKQDGRTYTAAVHRLVAAAFIPNPDNLPQVNHKNEIKTDNRVENLEWCTCSYNINYGTRNAKTAIKMKAYKEATVAKRIAQIDKNTGEILRVWPSAREAARQMGVEHINILLVCRGVRKSSCGFKWEYAS